MCLYDVISRLRFFLYYLFHCVMLIFDATSLKKFKKKIISKNFVIKINVYSSSIIQTLYNKTRFFESLNRF